MTAGRGSLARFPREWLRGCVVARFRGSDPHVRPGNRGTAEPRNRATISTTYALFVPGIQSALDPAGPQSGRIYSLFSMFTWITGVVYVIVIVWLIAAMIRSTRRVEPDVTPEGQRPATIAVSVGAALTVVILLVMLVASVATGSAVGHFAADKPNQLEIDVNGHQWWWEVNYTDPEPDKSFKTANEIHIPLGRPVLLRLATRDVIHSLWIPNLHGKRDLIPGRVNKLWIQADRPGVYRAQCAEFCGFQHAHMSLLVVAEAEKDFQQWKAHQQSPAPEAVTPQQVHGREVFLSLPCVNCHAITGIDAYATIGPDLTHIASRRTLAAGELMNSKGALAGWIVNAPAIKPGTAMPPNQIEGNDLQDLLAYLENLK